MQVQDFLRTKGGPKGFAIAELMKATGVDATITLSEPALTKDGVSLKIMAKVTVSQSRPKPYMPARAASGCLFRARAPSRLIRTSSPGCSRPL